MQKVRQKVKVKHLNSFTNYKKTHLKCEKQK